MAAIGDQHGAFRFVHVLAVAGALLLPAAGGCGKGVRMSVVERTAAAAPLGALPRLSPGDRRIYDVRAASAAELGGKPLTEFEVSGQLVVTAIEADANHVGFVAHLAAPRLHTQYASLQPEFSKLERDLETPFVFELAPGGEVRSFAFRDDPSSLVLGLRRWLGAALQAPPRGPGAAWTAEETDATGRYTVRYVATGAAGVYQRKKLGYLAPAAGASMPSVVVDSSEGTLRLADSGAVDGLEVDEALHTTASQMLPVRSSSHLVLRTLSSDHAGVAELSEARAQAEGAHLFEPAASQASRESPAVDDARIAGRSLPEILIAFRQLQDVPKRADEAARKQRERQRADLFAALTALARRRPDTVQELARRIESGDELAAPMIDALGAAGTPEAHRVLGRVLAANRLDPVRLKIAALALSRTQHPTAESIEGLRSLLDVPALRTQAMYGLGTSVRRLREAGDEPRAEQILQIILDRLQRTKDPLVIVTALRAIANSGHEKAFSAVERQLASADSEVRGAASEALQLMPDPRVDAKLAARIADDSVIEVRVAALRAARLRTPSPLIEKAVIQSARTDATPAVRLGAVRALERWMLARPSLRPVLEDIAAHETHDSVRAEARSALAIRVGAADGTTSGG